MSRNAPPPLLPILFGKPQTFAMPTAEPTDARMNPQRVEKLFTFFFFIDSLSTGKPACFPIFTKFYYFKALL